ncbi:MAG: hypothetical protein AAF333_07495 [Planctomycetota bacterium]
MSPADAEFTEADRDDLQAARSEVAGSADSLYTIEQIFTQDWSDGVDVRGISGSFSLDVISRMNTVVDQLNDIRNATAGGSGDLLDGMQEIYNVIDVMDSANGTLYGKLDEILGALTNNSQNREWGGLLYEELESIDATTSEFSNDFRAWSDVMQGVGEGTRDAVFAIEEAILDAGNAGTGGTTAAVSTASPNTLFSAVDSPADGDPIQWQDPEATDPVFEEGSLTPFELDAIEREGRQQWTIGIDTTPVFAALGVGGGTSYDLTTDLAWLNTDVGGTSIHEILKAAILASVGIWAALFLFEEFRRTA